MRIFFGDMAALISRNQGHGKDRALSNMFKVTDEFSKQNCLVYWDNQWIASNCVDHMSVANGMWQKFGNVDTTSENVNRLFNGGERQNGKKG